MTPLRTIGLQALSILVCGTAFAQSPRPAVETIQGDPFAAMEQFARCGARFEIAPQCLPVRKSIWEHPEGLALPPISLPLSWQHAPAQKMQML